MSTIKPGWLAEELQPRLADWCLTHPTEAAQEIERLRTLLDCVLTANIAQGCKPGHPRVSLVLDIEAALSKGPTP